jgi:hypothetical protein
LREDCLVAADDTSYDLRVFYSVTRVDDIDILEEGVYAQDRYHTPTEALGDLGHFIRENGGPELWDEIDQYEVGSCWLRHGPGTEISYNARLDRVVEPPLGTAPRAGSRTPAMLTWGRLKAATLGGLSRTDPER